MRGECGRAKKMGEESDRERRREAGGGGGRQEGDDRGLWRWFLCVRLWSG